MTFLLVIMCILGSIGVIMFVVILVGAMGGGKMGCGGCLSLIFGLFLIGGYIFGNVYFWSRYDWDNAATLGVAIVNLVGIILGIIAIKFIKWDDSSSGSSYSSSGGSSSYSYMKSRENDPHTCGNCTKYSSARGECRLNGNSMSAGDSCSNWC